MNLFSTALALFAQCMYAHMVMKNPAPYGNPDSSPLQPVGADFPCKLPQTSGFRATNVTVLTVGSTTPLLFTGSAVHNGGSCQISLSQDRTPSPNSSWKVIYSIEGGCPGISGQVSSYNVPIPEEVPVGDYSLAWTWFNNVGNREMYMNCAPVAVQGGHGTRETFQSLPEMAIYNIASKNDLKTLENYDVLFPNPGKYVVRFGDKHKLPVDQSGVAVPAISAASQSPPALFGAPPGSMLSSSLRRSTLETLTKTRPAPTNRKFGDYTIPHLSTVTAKITQYQQQPSGASVPPAPMISTQRLHTSGAQNSMRVCPVDGLVVCSQDGTQFGLCNFGQVIMQPVAPGTKCVHGIIQRRHLRDRREEGHGDFWSQSMN